MKRYKLCSFALFLVLASALHFALWSMPLHPDLLKQIERGEIQKPYWLEHYQELRARGIESPTKIQLACDIASGAMRADFKAIAILVYFSDNADTARATYFDTLLYENQVGTLRHYYDEVTYGNLTIVTLNLPAALGWKLMPETYAYYVNDTMGFGTYPHNAQKLAEDAVVLADPFVNYADYDNDGDGYVDALFIIHAGPAYERTLDSNDVWSHKWVMQTPQHLDGVTDSIYTMEPAYWDNPGDMTCGVYAHEMGHSVFGLLDLYDYDTTPSELSQGLGRWSLMAGGSWNGPLGSSPAHPDAWSRIQMGVVVPTILSSNVVGASIPAIENSATLFRLWTNGAVGQQYMLVENRRQTGYDTHLPAQGLLIYHVDEAISDNDHQWYPGHTGASHYLVALEQADGQWHLEQNMNSGDAGDPYPGATNNRTCDNNSTPDSRDYNFNITGVAALNISNSAPVMTADLYLNALSGNLSGTLGPGTYHVIGEISLDNWDDSLRLMPGTTFVFDGPYPFRINGTLLAEGTESDSIKFTTNQSGENRWRGLRFSGSMSSGSRLAYCLVEKGYSMGDWPNGYGGGVYCISSSSPTFTHCTISGNSASADGGGVYCTSYSSPTFTHCTISSNAAMGSGGVSCSQSSPSFTNCIISNNSGNSGGVYCFSSSPSFSNCTISGNAASWRGGGVNCNNSAPTFINSTLSGNTATQYGGGVYCSGQLWPLSPSFTNCTLSGNSATYGGGMYCYQTYLSFKNSIIAFSTGSGIYFENSSDSQVRYCDLYGNSGGNFQFLLNDPSYGPPGIGQLTNTNANGDPCDTYRNIFLDPLFVNGPGGDYHLTDLSHCIGAANPSSPPPTDFEGNPRPNPPGTNPDIGMDENSFGIPQVPSVTDLVISIQSGNAVLNWSPLGAENYNIYGATNPIAAGILLDTVTDTTWTDFETSSRPTPYFYYVTSVFP
jgi:immune inhibitor A